MAATTTPRYEALRRQFADLTRGARDSSGRYRIPIERWREIVTWLFTRLIEVLLSAARTFWDRLDAGERERLRGFAKDLGLRPHAIAEDYPPRERGEIVRIISKGLGLRPRAEAPDRSDFMRQNGHGNGDGERYEQPHPGATGHPRSEDAELADEPEVDDADDQGTPGEQSRQADQESKHSYPTSDPPSNY
jgi:hypothetical protein